MKKILSFLLLVHFVFAQDSGLPFGQLPPTIVCGSFFDCLAFFFYKILKVILALALALSAIFIAWAGILYITKGGGKDEDIKKIHQSLVWATIGLIVALLSYAFVLNLERWIRNIQQEEREQPRPAPRPRAYQDKEYNNYVYLFNFVYAQIQEPTPPQKLKCGPVYLPSVLQRSDLSGDIWKDCLIYYAERFLSFLYILALMTGVIFISWAGVLYIMQPEKSKDIHWRLVFGIFGIVLAILSFTIVKIIKLFFASS
jgi:magnesium-transporting ATPase (P-type)